MAYQSDMSLIEQVIQEFERARKEGKQVNEERYKHIIQGYEDLRGDQRTRLAALDTKFGTLASDLSTLSGNISDAMKSIADGTRSDVIGKGEARVEDTAGRFDAGQSRLEGLAAKAGVEVGEKAEETSEKIGELGKGERTGLLGRGRKNIDSLVEKFKKEASAQRKIVESGRGKVKAGYEALQSKDDASRNSAAEKVLSGYEKSVDKIGKLFGGAQKTAKAGFEKARGDVSADAADAAGRTEARFDEGRGGVGEDFAGARETATGITSGAIDKAGELGERARQETSSLAEQRLGDLRGGFDELGSAVGSSARATGAKFGGSLADLRDTAATGYQQAGADAASDYAGGRADVEGKFGAAKDERAGRYGARTEEGLSMYDQMGQASIDRINDDFERRKAQTIEGMKADLRSKGLSNTTIMNNVADAEREMEKNRQRAVANVESQVRQQKASAYERFTAQGMSSEDAAQASGLAASTGLLGQEKASQQRLRETGVGTDVALGREQAAGEERGDVRGDAAEMQAGLAGLAQQASGQQGISAAEQAIKRQALSGQLGALQQGTGAQMELAAREAAAKTGVRGQGLSASQQIEAEALARRAGLSGSEAAGTQALAGQQAGAMATGGMQTAAAADRIAQQNRAAGTQLGLSGLSAEERGAAALEQQMGQQGLARLSAQAAGEGQQRSADAALTGQKFGSQVGALGAGQSAAAGLTSQGMGNQANLLGQGLGLTGGQRGRLTDIDAQLAGAGQGARLGQEAANYGTQASVGLGALGQGARSDQAQTELGVRQREFEASREDPSVTLKDMADLVMAAGQSGMGSQGNVGTGLGSDGPSFAQQQMAAQNEWMRNQAVAAQEREQAAREQERERNKQQLRDRAKEQQEQRDREANIRKEERQTNEERFLRESKKLDAVRQEGQDKVDALTSELRAAEAAGDDAMKAELRKQLEEAKGRAKKLEEGQKVIDDARNKASQEGGRMGNITVNVTTGAVTVSQQEATGGDGKTKYETVDEKGNVSYQDEPDLWGGVGTSPPTGGGFGGGGTTSPTTTTTTPPTTTTPAPTDPAPTEKPKDAFGNEFEPDGTPGGQGTTPPPQQQPTQPPVDQPGQPPRPAGVPEDAVYNPETDKWIAPDDTPYSSDGTEEANYGDGAWEGVPGGKPKPEQPPAGEQPTPVEGHKYGDDGQIISSTDEYGNVYEYDSDGNVISKTSRDGEVKNFDITTLGSDPSAHGLPSPGEEGFTQPAGEPGTEGDPGPTGPFGQPGANQLAAGDPWDSSQGSYSDFMDAQQAMIDVNGQQMYKRSDGTYGEKDSDPWAAGIAAGSEAGQQGLAGIAAQAQGQPQAAQAFNANPMFGQVNDVLRKPAGGQQLAAEEPINDQQMEAMMQVMPNVSSPGMGWNQRMGGMSAADMFDIYQTGVDKIYGSGGALDKHYSQGGGGGGGGIFGGGGKIEGFDPGPSGPSDGGSGGGSGGGLVAGGGGGFDSDYTGRGAPGGGMVNPYSGPSGGQGQILTSTGSYVNPSMFPQGTGQGGGSTTPNTGAGNQWEGWDFANQGGGGAGGGGLVAGGGGGFDSNYVGKGAPGSGMTMPQSGRSGNPGAAVGYRDTVTAPGASRPSQFGGAPDAGIIAQNRQRASLAGLSNQASGIPRASNQSVVSLAAPQGLPAAPGMSMAKPNMKRKAKGGLGALANQASGMGMMQKPNLTYG